MAPPYLGSVTGTAAGSLMIARATFCRIRCLCYSNPWGLFLTGFVDSSHPGYFRLTHTLLYMEGCPLVSSLSNGYPCPKG